MSDGCGRPLGEETLIAYWLGELPDQEGEAVEEHLFSCDACPEALRRVADLAAAVGDVVRRGAVNTVVTPSLLESFVRDGLRLREYRLASGESVPCSVGSEDQLVITRLSGDFSAAGRLDVIASDAAGRHERIAEDIPLAPEAKEIAFARSAALLRTLPEMELKISVLDVRADGPRPLSEYTLRHSALRRD